MGVPSLNSQNPGKPCPASQRVLPPTSGLSCEMPDSDVIGNSWHLWMCIFPLIRRFRHTMFSPFRAAARANLRAVGWTDDDLAKPIITIAVPYTNTMPCNNKFRDLADVIAKEVNEIPLPPPICTQCRGMRPHRHGRVRSWWFCTSPSRSGLSRSARHKPPYNS